VAFALTEDRPPSRRRVVMLHSLHHLEYRYDLGPKLRDERPARARAERAPSPLARLVAAVRRHRTPQLERSTA
jgi:hypothetical protein